MFRRARTEVENETYISLCLNRSQGMLPEHLRQELEATIMALKDQVRLIAIHIFSRGIYDPDLASSLTFPPLQARALEQRTVLLQRELVASRPR